MRLSFHHANPGAGNESFLLRFDGEEDETPCILVDAGPEVDLDPLLGPNDRLAAVCLTHAHLDHYSELAAAHRHDAPILTSPATASVLDDVFDVAGSEYGVETTEATSHAVTPVDGWTDVAPGIDVRPVPAGHVPGAVGFLIRVDDGDRTHRILATGDFTTRRAGGFPGFTEEFVDVDVLFLTAATNDDFEASLTDALGTALEHAHGGAPTLVTTSGMAGVQVAHLLSAISAEYGLRVPIRVVGQVAKLYEALGYDCPGVETVPYFERTEACLDPGSIAIAGPDIPTERSSGRLFGVLRERSNACVVQLVGSGGDPRTGGRCTIHDYELVNHPTRETLVDVHDAVDPVHTVITHRHRGAQQEFNEDFSSVVWASGDTNEYTLFDGTHWLLPPWMSGRRLSGQNDRSVRQFAGSDLLDAFDLPGLDRYDDPDLEAEGVDVAQLETLLHRAPRATGPDVPTPSQTSTDAVDAAHATTNMTTERDDSRDSDDSTDHVRPPTGLVRTTGPGPMDELDPALQAALDEGSLTSDDLVAALAARRRLDERPSVDSENGAAETKSADDEPDGEAEDGVASSDGPSAESSSEGAAATESDAPTDADDGGPTGDDNADASATDASATDSDGRTDDSGGPNDSEAAGDAASQPASMSDPDDPEPSAPLELNPIAAAIAARLAEQRAADATVDDVVVDAVDGYVIALLADEVSAAETEQFSLDVDASELVEGVLAEVVAADDRFEFTSDLVAAAVASVIADGASGARTVSGLGAYRRHLAAIEANDAYGFDDTEAVVEAAVAWYAAEER